MSDFIVVLGAWPADRAGMTVAAARGTWWLRRPHRPSFRKKRCADAVSHDDPVVEVHALLAAALRATVDAGRLAEGVPDQGLATFLRCRPGEEALDTCVERHRTVI
jgi:hypothetical protein